MRQAINITAQSKETINEFTELVRTILATDDDQATIQKALDMVQNVFSISVNISDCDFNLAPDDCGVKMD